LKVNYLFYCAIACFLSFCDSALAQQSVSDSVRAIFITAPIHLDGKLEEAAWSQAFHLFAFTQREPLEGSPASERTELAVLYNESSLYFGIWCFDSDPTGIIASKMSRDFDRSSEDNVALVLDTYHDKRNGYLFVTNPLGAMTDALIMNNGALQNIDWDGVWQVKTTITDKGWFAEIEIPFSTLKFSSSADQVWGINVERCVRRKHEQVALQGWSRNAQLVQVSRAGTLTGLQLARHSQWIELKPYALGGSEWQTGSRKTKYDLGGDVNYSVTPTLKLNATVNPDFAQVESDRVQINLTRFSLYYPEKRKFFLEGRDVFDFGLGENIKPFYSRRIGLAEDGSKITVLGGARLLGKEGNTTLGVMSLQTEQRDTIPSANYSVIRWKQDMFGESSIGLFSTARSETHRFNGVYGGDALYSTSEFLTDKALQIGGAYAQSQTSDSAVHSGMAHRLSVDYPNDLIGFTSLWERASHGFNPELGFLRRTDYQRIYTELQWKPRPRDGYWIKQFIFQPGEIDYYINDRTRQLESFYWELRPLAFSTRSGEWIETNVQRSADHPDQDFEIHEGVIIPARSYWWTHYEAQVGTYEGRPLWAYAFVNWGDYYSGRRAVWQYELAWHISGHMSLSGDYTLHDIRLPQGRFSTRELGGRADLAVSPTLFGSCFGQWNNDDKEVQLNIRVNWIPRQGSDFYFVVNQSYNADRKWHPLTTTVLSKLIWRFVI
jgi:hypothetical protein